MILASHNEPAGPLAFMMVSQNWQRELPRSPFLWSQIWIQNDEDEVARIWTFLHLSGHIPLDVHITTVLPNTDHLQLIKPHLSRVRTISIRTKPPHPLTNSYADQWKRVASNTMATFSDRVTPWNATDYSCSGWGIYADPTVYHVTVMQFFISSVEDKQASTNRRSRKDFIKSSEEEKRFCIWENYVTRYACLFAAKFLPR
jgi:hypothetical protein